MKLAVLSELFKNAPSTTGSIYDRRFVTKELICEAVNGGYIKDPLIEPLSQRLTAPPFTQEKLALLEYLVARGGKPVNPNLSAFVLAESLYANPTDSEVENCKSTELDLIEVYQLALGDTCSIRQKIMLLLMKYGESVEIDADITDMLLSSDQYRLVEFGIRSGVINPSDPELLDKTTCRGDARAIEFLYAMCF